MPKIFLIPEFDYFGGARTYFRTLIQYYKDHRFDVIVGLTKVQLDVDRVFIAQSPRDYCNQFTDLLKNPKEGAARSLRALREVYEKHTTFHRAGSFVQGLCRLAAS